MNRIYEVGTKLRAVKNMEARQLEMSNPNMGISKGDILTIERIDNHPNNCVEFTLSYENKHGDFDLIVWNGEPEFALDNNFEIVEDELL